jgi:hypothetical protein
VRYSDPPVLEVQIWQGGNTVSSKPCVDSADVATEARRQFNINCQPSDPTLAGPR